MQFQSPIAHLFLFWFVAIEFVALLAKPPFACPNWATKLLFDNKTIQLEKDSFNSSDFHSFLRLQLFTDQEIFDAAYNIQMNPSLQLENNDPQQANDPANASNSRSELISYQPVQVAPQVAPIDFTEFLNLDETLNTPQPTGSLGD